MGKGLTPTDERREGEKERVDKLYLRPKRLFSKAALACESEIHSVKQTLKDIAYLCITIDIQRLSLMEITFTSTDHGSRHTKRLHSEKYIHGFFRKVT